MERLVLIDGNAILHRAYHALPEWRNKEGEATSGIYGFFSMLLKVGDEFKPGFLVVAFDHPSPNFRHSIYVGYQHGRVKDRQLEEDIWTQVEKLKDYLGEAGVAVFQVEGFEADDVIGSIAGQAVAAGSIRGTRGTTSVTEGEPEGAGSRTVEEVIIVTGDRDLLQLVNQKIRVYMPVRGLSEAVLWDREGVREKLGVWPEQVVDYKSLVGDTSDNYPGVTGIGPVTAVKLLGKYGTMGAIYDVLAGGNKKAAAAGGLEEKTVKKLVEGHEAAVVSRQLAEIRRDVPVTLDLAKAEMPGSEVLAGVLSRMGYPSLVKRIMGGTEPAGVNVRTSRKGGRQTEGQMGLV